MILTITEPLVAEYDILPIIKTEAITDSAYNRCMFNCSQFVLTDRENE